MNDASVNAVPPASESGPARLGADHQEVVVIEPSVGWRPLQLRELWRYRELLWFLAARDVMVRYKQTALGVAWAVIQPLFTMIVFSVFFGKLAQMPSDGAPYPLFAMAGLLPWQLFAYSLTQATNSVVNEQRLISKVYFPRLIVPLSSVLSGVVDFCIAMALTLGMMAWFGVAPSLRILALPGLVLLALVAAIGVGLWLSALNVQYRDVRYTIPFLTQFWMFLTPIAYPSSLVPDRYRPLYGLNPMAGVVDGFRWALLGGEGANTISMIVSTVASVVVFVGGLFYFRRIEKSFADVV